MPMTPEQCGRFIQDEILRWGSLARERKMSLDDEPRHGDKSIGTS